MLKSGNEKIKNKLPKQYQVAIPEVSATFLHPTTSVTSLLAVRRTPKKREGKMTCQANHAGERLSYSWLKKPPVQKILLFFLCRLLR